MADEKTQKASKTNKSVPLTDILYRTLHYWPWVLLSLFVCMGSAILYLLCTPSVYTASGSILVKIDNSSAMSPMGVGGEEFANMGLFQNKTNIQNEITTISSSDLMAEVVNRLKLDYNYYLPGTFHKKVAYGNNLPVETELIAPPALTEVKFDLDVAADKTLCISHMKIGNEDIADGEYKGKLNDTIPTAAGDIVVKPTEHYNSGKEIDMSVSRIPKSWATAGYASRLVVALNNRDGSVIDLTITDYSTQRATDILNTLIGVYNENWITDKNQIAVSTSNFINDRLGVIESELGNVDSDISSYKSANLIPDVNAAASMYMSQSQETQQQILDLSNQLQMTRYIRSYLANGTSDALLPANSTVNNATIGSLISAYNNKVLQRNNLVSKSSESNPLVMQLDEQLAAERQVIIRSIDNEITNLSTQIKALRGNEAQLTSRIASNPTQAKNLLSVERQQKVKESLYLFLLQKREENELSQAFTAYNTRIVKKPAAWGPTAPNSKKILLFSFLFGLAIPFGIVFLKENSNTRIRGRKDLENMTPPLLGEIPQHVTPGSKGKKKNEADRVILVKPESRNIINEAFRVLRTNTEFSRINKEGCNVIALTSFNPGSGKSFITMNLAAAIAIKGKRVLVIDGDMRHGSSSSYVEKAKAGLSDYLGGEHDNVKSLLVTSEDIKTLQVLPIGTVPPNPTELLESPRFGELIKQMRPHYDYIIIDCPPIEVVADAQIIDQYADRTIFIIRAGLFERSMLAELDRLYDEKKYKHMAVILNGTRNDQGRYGYSHTYKYGYGYGYGYGYNYDSKKEKE